MPIPLFIAVRSQFVYKSNMYQIVYKANMFRLYEIWRPLVCEASDSFWQTRIIILFQLFAVTYKRFGDRSSEGFSLKHACHHNTTESMWWFEYVSLHFEPCKLPHNNPNSYSLQSLERSVSTAFLQHTFIKPDNTLCFSILRLVVGLWRHGYDPHLPLCFISIDWFMQPRQPGTELLNEVTRRQNIEREKNPYAFFSVCVCVCVLRERLGMG